jgi:hypothetical protein
MSNVVPEHGLDNTVQRPDPPAPYHHPDDVGYVLQPGELIIGEYPPRPEYDHGHIPVRVHGPVETRRFRIPSWHAAQWQVGPADPAGPVIPQQQSRFRVTLRNRSPQGVVPAPIWIGAGGSECKPTAGYPLLAGDPPLILENIEQIWAQADPGAAPQTLCALIEFYGG